MRFLSLKTFFAAGVLFLAVFFSFSATTFASSYDQGILDQPGGKAKFTTESRDAGGLFKGVTIACWHEGSCTLCDGLVVFINVANGILRLLAIVAVLFFVYGAGLLVLSQGNEDLVSKGKGALKATVIGTIIVLVAWQVMSLVVFFIASNSIGGTNEKDKAGLSGPLNWYNAATLCNQGGTVTLPPPTPEPATTPTPAPTPLSAPSSQLRPGTIPE